MWVRPELRRLRLAHDMIVYFFGYCGSCMVHNFNPMLPPHRRIDPRGVEISIKNRYPYAGRSEAVAFAEHIEEMVAGEFAEMAMEYKAARERNRSAGANRRPKTGAVPGINFTWSVRKVLVDRPFEGEVECRYRGKAA